MVMSHSKKRPVLTCKELFSRSPSDKTQCIELDKKNIVDILMPCLISRKHITGLWLKVRKSTTSVKTNVTKINLYKRYFN